MKMAILPDLLKFRRMGATHRLSDTMGCTHPAVLLHRYTYTPVYFLNAAEYKRKQALYLIYPL